MQLADDSEFSITHMNTHIFTQITNHQCKHAGPAVTNMAADPQRDEKLTWQSTAAIEQRWMDTTAHPDPQDIRENVTPHNNDHQWSKLWTFKLHCSRKLSNL